MLTDDSVAKFDSYLETSPSVFLAFGSPLQGIDFDEYNEAITDFLSSISQPKSILIISPFWSTDKVLVTGSRYPELIYDFEEYNDLPEVLHLLTYPCAGNMDLAESVKKLLDSRDIETEIDEDRGLDKGAWIPMYVAYPDMDIPVVQLSLPKNASPELLFKMGQTLADLRKTGTMIVTTGNLVHDKNKFDINNKNTDPEVWAKELDDWIRSKIAINDFDALLNMKMKAPHKEKLIDFSRFNPLYFLLGTMKQKDLFKNIFHKFYYGNTSMSSFAFVDMK